MPKEPLSLFHEHLLLFLQDDLHQKKNIGGWDEATDSEVRSYRDILSKTMRGSDPLKLQEIIERYKHIFEERGPVHLEHKILEAFSEQEMRRIGSPPLRMYRGLPRLYRSKSSSSLFSRIRPDFSHLPSLKRIVLTKTLYSLYADLPVASDSKVVLLAGTGDDFAFAIEGASILKRSFPFLDLELIIFESSDLFLKCEVYGNNLKNWEFDKEAPQNFYLEQETIAERPKTSEDKDFGAKSTTSKTDSSGCCGIKHTIWEKEAEFLLQRLRGSDLILQMPSRKPRIEELFKRIAAMDDARPLPKFEILRRHALEGLCSSFLYRSDVKNREFEEGAHSRTYDSSYCFCMPHSTGLHFLERGIFLRQISGIAFSELENESVMYWLFGQLYPGPWELEDYRKKNRFFLSCLKSQSGVLVYLHALCKSLEWDEKAIDLCVLNPAPFLEYFRSRLSQKNDLLGKSCKISRIVLCIGSYTATLEVQPVGKTLRILSPNSLNNSDIQRLGLFSEDFMGICNEEGLSDAVSANRGFFFDPSSQCRYLMKDLIALAENRIASHRSTLGILRLYVKVLEHHLPSPGEGEWIDEISIQGQEKVPLEEIAGKIGLYLQDPDALVGFKKLNRLIAKEHNCNDFFRQIVQRAVCHRKHPEIAWLEENVVSKFTVNQISLTSLVHQIKDALAGRSSDLI